MVPEMGYTVFPQHAMESSERQRIRNLGLNGRQVYTGLARLRPMVHHGLVGLQVGFQNDGGQDMCCSGSFHDRSRSETHKHRLSCIKVIEDSHNE